MRRGSLWKSPVDTRGSHGPHRGVERAGARVQAELALEAVDAEPAIHLSQHELATLVGVPLNTVEEAPRHLAGLGLVIRRYRSIIG